MVLVRLIVGLLQRVYRERCPVASRVARDVAGSLKFDNPETVWGCYEDELVKIDGRWWFKDRVAHVDDEAAVNRVWDFMRKNAAVFLARSEELYE